MPKIKLPPRTDGFRKMPVKVKKCMCGDCEECLKNFSHFLQIFSGDESLPEISAKSWCIWRKSKKFLKQIRTINFYTIMEGGFIRCGKLPVLPR